MKDSYKPRPPWRPLTDLERELLLEKSGWVKTESGWSNPNGFDCSNLCLDDAFQLMRMIESWGKETQHTKGNE